MRLRCIYLATLLVPLLLLTGCGGDANPGSASAVPLWESSKSDGTFGFAWVQMIEEARAEGELVIVLGSSRSRSYRLLLEAFTEKFGIRVLATTGSGSSSAQRVLAERGHGRFSSDVVIISPRSMERLRRATALAPLEPLLIHPEVTDRSRGWLFTRQDWLGQEPGYIATTALRVRANISDIYYNFEKVSPKEITEIQSWQDLLDKRWRGRVACILDPNSRSATSSWRTAWTVLGGPWFDRFIREVNPVLLPYGSERELVDGLARGKYDLVLFASYGAGVDIQRLAAVGMPVKKLTRTLAEGHWASLSGAIGIFDNAPHPRAAQLFVNWYMSQDGQSALQTLIQSADPRPSLRTDVPQGRVADYAWDIARNINEHSVIREDPEWDSAALQQSMAFMKSICSELGCYGY